MKGCELQIMRRPEQGIHLDMDTCFCQRKGVSDEAEDVVEIQENRDHVLQTLPQVDNDF